MLSCLNFEKGSRSVKAEFAFWYETLSRWYKEGLPEKKGLPKNTEVIERDTHIDDPAFATEAAEKLISLIQERTTKHKEK